MSDIIGSKGQSEHVHYEAPDSLHSTSYARVLDLVSEGEVLGLTNGLQSVLLDGTPVQNADGTKNFTGVTVDFRTGTQTQDYIPGFPSVENEVGVGVELKYGTPWVHAISNTALSAIRIILGVPALSKSDTTNGDIKGYKVDYQIELSKDGGAYAVVLSSSFNGKTTTAYQRSARIDLPKATTGWSLRVSRLTTNANTASIADMTTIISYTDVVDAKLRYPMSAIVGVQVDAKQFSSVPTRAYDLMGRIIQVPSNYDAKTRAYTGNWDGTFKPSWSDNPAWVFRDIALNDRYGLGHRITAAQLDKWSLYAIARYCDGLVPDGKGGTEPRFTCNVYLQTQKQAYAVLQDLASVFRGISYWGAGAIIASADMPSDPVYVYTAANVIGGKFSRVGSSKKTRFTTALVSWNDPADLYKAKVEYTEDAEGIARYGIQPVSLTAFGCSSQGQAQRVGRWALATSRLETEMISFDVGMDGAIALPGQIVRVADPSRMGRRNGGRIKAATGRIVILDKAPVINAGDKLTVVLPTGKSETRVVASVAADAVTVTADWSIVPNAQSVWSVDSTVLIAPTYKIRSITEKDAATYTVTATQHEPGKFDFVENGTAITPRPQTALNAAVQQPPASVAVVAYTVSLQDVQKLGFTATCAAVDGAVAYEGAFQHDNSNWFIMPRQPGPVFDILDVLDGNYTVKIAAVNSVGVTSIETLSASTLVSKNANPKNAGILLTPSAQGFNVNADGSITPASITVHADLLALDGIVSWSAVGATITSSNNNATIVATNMPGAAMTLTASLAALGQTFTRSIDIVKSADGAAGASNYTWVKYATSATGTGLTDNPAGMTFIGFAFNRSSPVESTVATDYTWSSVTGPAGTSTFTGVVYLQQLAQPSTPTGGTFNFTTSALTPPASWSATQPTSSTVPTWAVRYTFTAATLGATVTAGTWSTPTNISQNGGQGAPGIQSMVVFLYQYNSATPAAPNGTSTLNWVTGANSSYNGTDSWATVAPANPGTPGLRLYVATQPVTAAGGTTSTAAISYASAGISAWSQNGNNGANGAQSATATVYQSAVTIPAGPVGSNTFTWSTGLFGDAPPNWSLAPSAPVPGSTKWAATVRLVDTAVAATTGFNWSAASITAQGYDGGNGTIGADGLSYVTAYVATTVGTASTAPAPTTGKTSVPAPNSSGLPGTPQLTVPTLTAGQYMMEFDGSYNKATDMIMWSIPYQASLKVGSLSAITTNTGALTVTGDFSSANGKFLVDANGQMTASAATFKLADGTVLFSTGTGLTAAGAAPGTLNSDVAVAGRNLAIDSAFERGLRAWTTRSGAVKSVAINGASGAKNLFIETNGGDAYVLGENLNVPVTPGATYVIAFDYATATSGTINGSSSYMSGNGVNIALPFSVNNTATVTVRSQSVIWTCPTGTTSLQPRFGLNSTGYSWLAVFNFKVAVGNKDTSWSAAPEDLAVGISSAQSTATSASQAASSAQDAANAAAIVANAAKARTDAAGNDNVLSKEEKGPIVLDFTTLQNNRATITAQATSIGVTFAAYTTAYNALVAYLQARPDWNTLTTDTTIDGPTFRGLFADTFNQQQVTLNAISAKLAVNAAAAQTAADKAAVGGYTAWKNWEFVGTREGWTATNANIQENANSITLSATAGDPNLYMPATNFFSGALYDKVRMRVRRLSGASWQGTIYFATASGHGYDGNYQKTVAATVGADWVTVEWDMSALTAGGSNWVTSTITNLRFDLGDDSVSNIEIDWISIGKYAPAPSIDVVGAAATTALWSNIAGQANAPANNATYGGELGVNIAGQITAANALYLVGSNAITNSMFGGDLLSLNWNGRMDSLGTGWAIARSGKIYCTDLAARGSVTGGAFNENYAWPSNGAGGGFHISASGALWGNPNQPGMGYTQIGSNGELHMPGLDYAGRQLTLDGPIILRPKYGDNVVGSVSGGGQYYTVGNNIAFTDKYVGTYGASMTNSSGNLTFAWSTETSSGAITLRVSGTSAQSCIVYATGRLTAGQELDMIVRCNIIDVTSNFTRNAETFFTIGSPS